MTRGGSPGVSSLLALAIVRQFMLTPQQLDALRQLDTCTLANAIERFGLRLRNQGYTRPGLRCVTRSFPSVLGYAATCRVKSSNPSLTGSAYDDRTDWWAAMQQLPCPRFAVIEDIDAEPGMGASVGELHASILKALKCVAVVTNGAVRDLPAVAALGMPMFACHVSVSHSYVHMVDYGEPVEICGLEIKTGDLLYADCHGVLSIPREIAVELPTVAAELVRKERRIISLCAAPDFSLDELRAEIKEL
jgi:regulator of RNase E activity RraA